MQAQHLVRKSIFYRLFEEILIPIASLWYQVEIINPENVYDGNTSCIYISRHTTHNWELLLGLFALNAYSKKVIRGLGHYLIYFLCPWYVLAGVVIGNRRNAEHLISKDEYLFIIPGGGEEMTYGSENVDNVYWESKSKKYKTGFAKLAYDSNIPVIPIHASGVKYMVWQPFIVLANALGITEMYDSVMQDTDSLVLYKWLYYVKMLFCVVFGSILVIPLPCKIKIYIGVPIYRCEESACQSPYQHDMNVIEFAKRCEAGLRTAIWIANAS